MRANLTVTCSATSSSSPDSGNHNCYGFFQHMNHINKLPVGSAVLSFRVLSVLSKYGKEGLTWRMPCNGLRCSSLSTTMPTANLPGSKSALVDVYVILSISELDMEKEQWTGWNEQIFCQARQRHTPWRNSDGQVCHICCDHLHW